jgi:hypothetical protein
MKLRDFARNIGDKFMPHAKQEAMGCPSITGWPEDDVSKWVASHRDETKNVICRSSEGKNVGFCGTTRSRTRTKRAETGAIETRRAETSKVGSRQTRGGVKATTRGKSIRKPV